MARGLSPREAMDLLVTHGVAERRSSGGGRLRAPARSVSFAAPAPDPRTGDEPGLVVGEAELARARDRLAAQFWPLSAFRADQRVLWSRAMVVEELGCGWEHGRLLIPIRGRSRELRGVLRYVPRHDRAPKMLAAVGTGLGLVPHPAAEPSEGIVLVEGPPDAISARSRGLSAVAVPGDHAWEPEWAHLVVGRRVAVVLDCDQAGRKAARRIAGDLTTVGVHGSSIDLAPDRDDGVDLTDWLYEHRDWPSARIGAALGCREAKASAPA